jgi:hypothetical protein
MRLSWRPIDFPVSGRYDTYPLIQKMTLRVQGDGRCQWHHSATCRPGHLRDTSAVPSVPAAGPYLHAVSAWLGGDECRDLRKSRACV